MPSMDKQLLIDFLDTMNSTDDPVLLSEDILCGIGHNYREVYSRIIADK
jgi:hypothetical protein